MVSTEAQSILRRKTAIGAKELEARAMSAAKAMRQSIAKIGKELFETPLSAIGVITELRKVDDISEVIQDGSLLCLLEGTNGKVGAAVISADIVGGLIQGGAAKWRHTTDDTNGCIFVRAIDRCII
jgi:flagellar motor switch protein FliM